MDPQLSEYALFAIRHARRVAAPSPRHIVPGHDPLVLRRYPAPTPALEGIVVRLDAMPRE